VKRPVAGHGFIQQLAQLHPEPDVWQNLRWRLCHQQPHLLSPARASPCPWQVI